MKIKTLWRTMATALASIAILAAFSSCQYDDTEIRNGIDDLNGRVEALEAFQEEIQAEIDALNDIVNNMQAQLTVNGIFEIEDGEGWVINFSDGTRVTLMNGDDGKDGQDGQDGKDGKTPPTIIIVEDGGTYYWAYEMADGSIRFVRDGNGNRVPVQGEAPQVRINPTTGNWEISVDGGLTWEDTGMPSSGGAGDSLISDVAEDEYYVYIILRDGTELVIPKTVEMNFEFGTDEEVLAFTAGETKELGYVMSGAADYTISKPSGWKVSLDAEKLEITAPVAENTFAEKEGVISVILVSANGASFLAELNVKVEDGGIVPPAPSGDPEIGDFYYADGTWSSELDASKTVIGIVYWVGDPAMEDTFLKADHPDCTHGLVVSIAQIDGPWQSGASTYGVTVDMWRQFNMPEYPSLLGGIGGYEEDDNLNSRYGYSNTKVIEGFNNHTSNASWPVEAVANIASFNETYPAPEGTSGWFLPSAKEVSLFITGEYEGNIFDIYGSEPTCAILLNGSLSQIPDAETFVTDAGYSILTSTETDNVVTPLEVYSLTSNDGSVWNRRKEAPSCYRYVLAF